MGERRGGWEGGREERRMGGEEKEGGEEDGRGGGRGGWEGGEEDKTQIAFSQHSRDCYQQLVCHFFGWTGGQLLAMLFKRTDGDFYLVAK